MKKCESETPTQRPISESLLFCACVGADVVYCEHYTAMASFVCAFNPSLYTAWTVSVG